MRGVGVDIVVVVGMGVFAAQERLLRRRGNCGMFSVRRGCVGHFAWILFVSLFINQPSFLFLSRY